MRTGVTGRFGPDGTGVFHGDDEYGGRKVKVRFVRSAITETCAHWEQTFSVDDGRTWHTDWHTDMTRREDRPAPVARPGRPAAPRRPRSPTARSGTR